jgi:hypothetical protein
VPDTQNHSSTSRHAQQPHRGLRSAIARPFTNLARRPIDAVERQMGDMADTLVPRLVDALLERIDLAALSRHIIDEIDLPGIVRQLIQDIDLPAITGQLLDDIDLAGIIRDSTSAVASESVVGMRMQGIGADQKVSRVVDRVLLRKGVRSL